MSLFFSEVYILNWKKNYCDGHLHELLSKDLEVICSVVYQLFPFGFFSVCFPYECDVCDLCLGFKIFLLGF